MRNALIGRADGGAGAGGDRRVDDVDGDHEGDDE